MQATGYLARVDRGVRPLRSSVPRVECSTSSGCLPVVHNKPPALHTPAQQKHRNEHHESDTPVPCRSSLTKGPADLAKSDGFLRWNGSFSMYGHRSHQEEAEPPPPQRGTEI